MKRLIEILNNKKTRKRQAYYASLISKVKFSHWSYIVLRKFASADDQLQN